MPEWMQFLYGIVLAFLIPFAGWVATRTQKNWMEITKMQEQMVSMNYQTEERKNARDRMCAEEKVRSDMAIESLSRIERNLVRIGIKLELNLEGP